MKRFLIIFLGLEILFGIGLALLLYYRVGELIITIYSACLSVINLIGIIIVLHKKKGN